MPHIHSKVPSGRECQLYTKGLFGGIPISNTYMVKDKKTTLPPSTSYEFHNETHVEKSSK